MLVDFEIKTQKFITKEDVCYVILKNNQFCLVNNVKAYQMKIGGKMAIDYVKKACNSKEIIEINYSVTDNVFELVKSHCKNKNVVCVLYADSPLINSSVLQEIWNLFLSSGKGICKLPRGYIMQINTLKEKTNVLDVTKIGEHLARYFIPINNLINFQDVEAKIREQINFYHIENGVVIKDVKNTYIDADVEIGENTIIYPNNYIYGETKIGSNCTIMPNNVIINSEIENDVLLKGAYIENCKIVKGQKVEPFTHIKKEKDKKWK